MVKKAAGAAAMLGVGAGLGAGAVAAYTGWAINAPRRPDLAYAFSPFEIGIEAEDVRFTTEDGLSIAGWWLDSPGAEVTVICCHGHRGGKADMLGIGPGLLRHGFNVLLFDFRGNGDSDDGPQSLAFHEQRDLSAAITWVRDRRPHDRIALVAFSMGAATAILTAAEDPRVEALVLDSPFATMREVVGAAYRRYRLPTVLLYVADLGNRWLYGYGFGQVRPVDAMRALAPRPVLLIHGTDDATIPYEHAELLVRAATPGTVELLEVPGAGHCGAYFLDRPGYIDRVAAFLRRALPPS